MSVNPQVEEFVAKLDYPLKAEMQRVREIILAADNKMSEVIKWDGPTFVYKGNLATLTPRTKRFVNLFFQTGAAIHDDHGILEGDAKEVRVARFHKEPSYIVVSNPDRPMSIKSLPPSILF